MLRMGDMGATGLVQVSALRSAHMHSKGDELRMSTLVIDRLKIGSTRPSSRRAWQSRLHFTFPAGAFHSDRYIGPEGLLAEKALRS